MLALLLLALLEEASCLLLRCSRSDVLHSAAFAAVSSLSLPAPSLAATGETYALLKKARTQLDSCTSLIENESWDGVRNVVKTPPLANVKALIKAYSNELGDDGVELMGPREDFVQAVQFLDTFVYNNIFISEQN
ncbi:MAG: hypothetical protein SGPRY_013563, partial [Prymnesium sp.]